MLSLESLGRSLIFFGVVLIVLGSMFLIFGKIPWFGRLPGDVIMRREGFTFYFPVVTMILVSIILTIIFTSIILLIVASGIPEPTTLIISWFAFTTVEVAVLAGIRKAEINMNPFNPYSPQNPHIYYGDKEPK